MANIVNLKEYLRRVFKDLKEYTDGLSPEELEEFHEKCRNLFKNGEGDYSDRYLLAYYVMEYARAYGFEFSRAYTDILELLSFSTSLLSFDKPPFSFLLFDSFMSRTVFAQHNIYFIKCQVIFVSILYMTSLLLSYFVHNAQNQSTNISAFHDCTFTMKRRSTCDKFIALKLLEKLYNIAILFSLVCHKQKRKSPVKSLPLL